MGCGLDMKILSRIRRIICFRTSGNEISYSEAMKIRKECENSVLLDVRSRQEYDEGHLPGAICIPVYELASNVTKIITDRDYVIICYCQCGSRSRKASKILDDLCYSNVYIIKGGLNG